MHTVWLLHKMGIYYCRLRLDTDAKTKYIFYFINYTKKVFLFYNNYGASAQVWIMIGRFAK